MSNSYVLRDRDLAEISRLKFQHQVWKQETEMAVAAGEFKAGNRLLDLGCGPGVICMDLLNLTGPGGEVQGIDTSEIFTTYLSQKAEKENLLNLRVHRGDISTLTQMVPAGHFDGAICRWVLMFVNNPQKIVDQTFEVLNPGGTFVSMEYYSFKNISLWPESKAFHKIYEGVYQLISENGGNPDMGSNMALLMKNAGFRIRTVIPVLRTGPSGGELWQWLERTGENHSNLVEAGIISQQDLDEYWKDWHARTENPHAFITAPPLMITVGEKPDDYQPLS